MPTPSILFQESLSLLFGVSVLRKIMEDKISLDCAALKGL